MKAILALGAATLAGLSLACSAPVKPPVNFVGAAPLVTRTATLPFPPPLPPLVLTRTLPPPLRGDARRLLVGATLRVHVAGVEALSQDKVVIGGDGKVFLPFLGRVPARGLSPLQLGERLARLLVEKGYLREAQVDVTPVRQPGQVYILGRVSSPGAFDLPVGRTLRLTQLVAMAGGLYSLDRGAADADPSALRLIREVDGKRRTYRISFQEITTQGRLDADVPLQADDVIYVPSKKELFVFGSVSKPGGFALLEGSRLGVDEVLALAGGFTEQASQGGLLVVRRKGSQVSTYRIPTDPVRRAEVLLTAGDAVIVPARGLRRVFVLGSVKSQGGIPLNEPDLTVTKVLALAGGLNRIAADNSVQLIRRGPDGKKHIYPVPVAKILSGASDFDPVLEPGDIVFVPEGFF